MQGFERGRNRTRTCDPIDVNDVLWLCGRVCNKIGDEKKAKRLEKQGAQAFRVTLVFADEPNEAAVAEELRILANVR